jgi:hypothetical protein
MAGAVYAAGAGVSNSWIRKISAATAIRCRLLQRNSILDNERNDGTGQERIDYIDLIRTVKKTTGAKAHIQKVPYSLFSSVLKMNGLFDKNSAFTVGQLKALVTPDIFEVINWPEVFGICATPLQQALDKTFQDPVYSHVALDFQKPLATSTCVAANWR